MAGKGKPRRPKGTGSIYERDGLVIGQYEVQTPEGKSKRKYVRGKDKKEVAGKLAKATAEFCRRSMGHLALPLPDPFLALSEA